MLAPILATKLYIPPPRPASVPRPRLVERLNEGLGRKLTLLCAPAGFGKTALLGQWVAACGQPAAWLSLDEGDSDPARFLGYLVAALQTVAAGVGKGVLAALQSPHPPPGEFLLTTLLNEIAALPGRFLLILDDYHAIDSRPVEAPLSVDAALDFLVEHLPPQMHLAIATREDPPLPLARLRARGQLTELRAADLRFTPAEAGDFLNRAMGLNLPPAEIAALESRTEGWIAGLQLAALALQGSGQGAGDAAGLIRSFTGSHHFVLDYLLEEVLLCQPESIQAFLLCTSVLERLCAPLCEALGGPGTGAPQAGGQQTLEYLERANLFIIPLDGERRWYRYHHLFRELLRQRLGQRLTPEEIAGLHLRASEWYEKDGQAFEAFRHAIAANDVGRAESLIERKGMPLHFRGVAMAVLEWLDSLPTTVLDARPLLRVRAATLALMAGQTSGVEEKLQAAEASLAAPVALHTPPLDEKRRDLIGQIACARATLALTRYQPEIMIHQARRALEYLPETNLTFRFTACWALASACLLQGERAAAAQACKESLSISRKSGDVFSTILASSTLGQIQELENQLPQAAETYRSILPLFGDHPQPNAEEVHLGLARICYEWNDLDAAGRHAHLGLQFARQYDRVIDRFILSEVFLARLKLARGEVEGAAASLAQVEQAARRHGFLLRMADIATVQVLVLLRQGNLVEAAQRARQYELPLGQARVLLAEGNASAALAVLEPFRQQMEARNWQDERLKGMVLQAVALQAHGEKDSALQTLGEALTLAEAGGFVRIFVDEGEPMGTLLADFRSQLEKQPFPRRHLGAYTDKLLAAFAPPSPQGEPAAVPLQSALLDPLSRRELEVLRLIAQGLSNQEIGERLFLALDTVKGHNRRIFDKLQVQRRTEAIARARELGLL